MKVGDLIKVNTAHGCWCNKLITPATVRHGQLGVIVGDPVLPEDRQWKVRLMDGELFWFDDFEMEVQQ